VADDQIKQQIENISGVGQIQIVGGAQREIQIRLNPDKMRAFGITVNDVVAALRQQNLELPGGRVEQGAQELTVRTMGRIVDPKEFNSIAVANRGSYVVRISDVERSGGHPGRTAQRIVLERAPGADADRIQAVRPEYGRGR